MSECELLFIKVATYLLEENILLSNLPEKEIAALLKVKSEKSLDINGIDIELKNIIDRIAAEYGILTILKKIIIMKRDVLELKEKYREGRISCDLTLFSIALNTFYDKIETIYSADIYLKIFNYFIQFQKGVYDSDAMLDGIVGDVISLDDLLGLEYTEGIQATMFDIEQPENPMRPLFKSFWVRDNIISEIKRTIKTAFTPREISEYLSVISADLQRSQELEHMIISRIIRKIKPELQKKAKKPSAKKENSMQLKLTGFN